MGLNNNSSTDTCKNAGGLSGNDITDGNIRNLKIAFSIDNIPIDDNQLRNMYWMPKMHKNRFKARFIIASPKSSRKPLARTITSIFHLSFRQIQTYNEKCRFFTGVNTFWVVQNNKPLIDATIGLNKQKKATSVSTFDFSTLYTKPPHNKFLMVRNSLIDFCFDGGESKYITINNYRACWVKMIKDNVICLNKQQMKDAVPYVLLNCCFAVGPKIVCQIIGILMGSDLAPFFANLFLYFYERKWMNKLKKNDLIKARNLCNILGLSTI